MEKKYLFKQYREGKNKTGNEYKMLELHDTNTLDNTTFFLRPDQSLANVDALKLKDRVIVVHGIENYNGKPQLTIESLRKE